MTQIKEIGLYAVELRRGTDVRVSFILKDVVIYSKDYKKESTAQKHFEEISKDIEWHHTNGMAWEYKGVNPRGFMMVFPGGTEEIKGFIDYKSETCAEYVAGKVFSQKASAWTMPGCKGSTETAGVYKLMCDRILRYYD
jgi:hypothetical protein